MLIIYFTCEWILSNSVPFTQEGEATGEQNQMSEAFLNSSRYHSVSETLFDYGHPVPLRFTT